MCAIYHLCKQPKGDWHISRMDIAITEIEMCPNVQVQDEAGGPASRAGSQRQRGDLGAAEGCRGASEDCKGVIRQVSPSF